MLFKSKSSSHHSRHESSSSSIPEKTNRVLNLILIAMFFILVRIWHLTVIQYENKVEEARKPRAKVVIEPAKRATIRDRFNIPFAINKIRYQAAVQYSQLKEIPSVKWETDPSGKRVKKFLRKEYITKLSQLLGKELDLDPERIEDLIYAKASLFYQIPFIIKEDISEKEYFRLKVLEKDWAGIIVQRIPKRDYPKGKVAADLIGYMGAINRQEYDNIIQEIKELDTFLQDFEAGVDIEFPQGLNSTIAVRNRLQDLREHAYTINDYVGKSGVEGRFEEELRGYHGRKVFYSDARGNFLRELPGAREPLSGHRFLLTISSELQEFCEKLLIQNEQIREPRLSEYGKHEFLQKRPWIMGGAIVAMDPFSGEILALASYPRFNPNDFILSGSPKINKEKRSNISQWFENETFLGQVWDQKRPLIREIYNPTSKQIQDEETYLTWEKYLELIFPENSPTKTVLSNIVTLKQAVLIQKNVHQLLNLTGQANAYAVINKLYSSEDHMPYKKESSSAAAEEMIDNFTDHAEEIAAIKKNLDVVYKNVPYNYDKVLIADICGLLACGERFSTELIDLTGQQSLTFYREATNAFFSLKEQFQQQLKEEFHQIAFKPWRKENEKGFLKQKRLEEKLAHKYAKPYIDYLDAKENELFQQFWESRFWVTLLYFLKGEKEQKFFEKQYPELKPYHTLLTEKKQEFIGEISILQTAIKNLNIPQSVAYLQTMRRFQDLDRPLLGHYKHLRQQEGKQLEKHLAAAFYPVYGYGFARSQAYRQATVQGSIFKLVTAYEALKQQYAKEQSAGKVHITYANLNPLDMVDDLHREGKNWSIGYDINGKSIPRQYKGGVLPRSINPHNGKLDLIRAIEVSSNPYFSLIAGDVLQSPKDLAETAAQFSYGNKTGIDLPGELAGRIPNDLEFNRTGLYAFAIGQHSFVVTPLQTAVMISSIANGGKILKPKIISLTAGRERRNGMTEVFHKLNFRFQDDLSLIGIDFPLFSSVDSQENKNLISLVSTEVKREIFMPKIIRTTMLQAMHQVVIKNQTDGIAALNRLYKHHPEAIQEYVKLKNELLGKTSTAEALENLNLDCNEGVKKCTHVWFGGISVDPNAKPDEKQTFLYNDSFGCPELVVVVYLRFGGYGKEAAPIAGQVVSKWREIKNRQVQ